MAARGRPVVLSVLAVVAALLAPAPPAQAAPLSGYDVSWPQCPASVGGGGLPMPPASAAFVVIGLTRGLPFTENPCLAAQVDWARRNGIPAQAYTIPAYPTAAQLGTYAGQGPWSTRTLDAQLSGVGYAEAQYALDSMQRAGFAPPVVWIDVEPRPAQPWPGTTSLDQRRNRSVVEGMMRRFHDAGIAYGLYSYTNGWSQVVGSWQLPGVPVWATAGHLDYPTEAQDRCTQPSFSGGAVLLSQWTDDTYDFDLTCGTYSFTPLPVPASSLSNSTADFDGNWTNDVLARRTSDGSLWLYPGDGRGGWQAWRQVGAGWNVFDVLETPGDWNGDGTLDVLAREPRTGNLWLYPGDGHGGWRPWATIGTGWNVMNALVGPGDFDGDGNPDVLARETATGALWLYPGNGHGGWLPRARVGQGWDVMNALVGPGDFDGDGNPDVLARETATGALWLYPGDGHGGWLPRARVGTGWNVMTALVGVGDFDGDRTADVLARDPAGSLWLYPGNGQGGWLTRTQAGTGWNGFDVLF